jgi:hypothetical protein
MKIRSISLTTNSTNVPTQKISLATTKSLYTFKLKINKTCSLIVIKEDYFECLKDERPPYRWVAIGPERSGTPFHIDPYRTSAWNGLISGRKRWCLYPYHQFPPGINMEWDDDGNFDHDSPYPLKWYLEVYPHLAPNEKPVEFILEPGELVFVPSGWWHQVINLEDAVAVTQNYCNDSNFEIVCSEMDFDDEDFYEGGILRLFRVTWLDFQECVGKKYPNIKWPTNMVGVLRLRS